MPPVQVVHDGTAHWLWEGFHRIEAAKQAGMKGIAVEITKGTQRDAFRLSLQQIPQTECAGRMTISVMLSWLLCKIPNLPS